MLELMINGVMGGMLLICGIQDFLKKNIQLWIIAIGALIVIICLPFSTSFSMFDRAGGFAVGAAVVVISLATGGKIGLGDGLLLCVTGLGLGFWGNLELFAVGLLGAALISILLLIFRIADRKKSIPFVPFLLLGYIFLTFTVT